MVRIHTKNFCLVSALEWNSNNLHFSKHQLYDTASMKYTILSEYKFIDYFEVTVNFPVNFPRRRQKL